MVYGGQLDEPTARALAGKAQRVKYKNFGGAKRLVTLFSFSSGKRLFAMQARDNRTSKEREQKVS